MKDYSNNIELTPKSMRTSNIWSPVGKTKQIKSYHWSYIPKKVRMNMVPIWTSKKEEYARSVYNSQINNQLETH